MPFIAPHAERGLSGRAPRQPSRCPSVADVHHELQLPIEEDRQIVPDVPFMKAFQGKNSQ